MILKLQRIILAASLIFMLAACSNSKEEEQQSAVEKTTEKIGKQAISNIRKPIEKAKVAKGISDDRVHNIEEAAKLAD